MIEHGMDLTAQASGIGLVMLGLQSVALGIREHICCTEALEGCLGLAVVTTYTVGLTRGREHRFLPHAQDGLEEVVVQPHLVVELVEEPCLVNCVESSIACVGTD